jgi:transposase-like protein
MTLCETCCQRRSKIASFLEWAPWAKEGSPWPSTAHSIEFKRQVAQEFLAGETLHGLSKRHDICRNLIRVWVQKYEAGAFNEDVQAADLLQQYEAHPVGCTEPSST